MLTKCARSSNEGLGSREEGEGTNVIGELIAAALLSFGKGGIELTLEADRTVIDPGRPVLLELTLKTARGVVAEPPDLRGRVRGFSLAEDFEEGDPETRGDGSTVRTVTWRLVPEPCAPVYKIAPFVIGPYWAGPVYFENPPPREAVTGGIETDPKKDMPPLSWKLVGWVALGLLGVMAALVMLVWVSRYVARRVKEHRMSPIERAWVELDRLLRKGLPGRGRYKDFYVELTMVVRRYVQRKYGIHAPHLTTEEYLRNNRIIELANNRIDELRNFLESADMVKFAGVEATPEMADEATDSARTYLKSDSAPNP